MRYIQSHHINHSLHRAHDDAVAGRVFGSTAGKRLTEADEMTELSGLLRLSGKFSVGDTNIDLQ